MTLDSHADSKEKPMLQDEFERQGMKPADARFEARRAYGGIEQPKNCIATSGCTVFERCRR